MSKVIGFARTAMSHVAGFIDYWSNGRVKPVHITSLSLIGHIPVAYFLVTGRPGLAAFYLAFFAGLDALDGALARLQGSASRSGMFFDAVSDRLKEVILYSALVVYAYNHLAADLTWQIVALCGTSLLVSYTKAKGEMAVTDVEDVQKLNRAFGIGIATYEIRMVAIIAGLLFGVLEPIIPLLISANMLTVAVRFLVIAKYLREIDQTKRPIEKKRP